MPVNDRQVMWTALPAGIVNGAAHVSVYVSPRLSPPATLAGGPIATTLGASAPGSSVARYAEFLHWASLSPLSFQVQLDQGGIFAATFTDGRQVALWNALFPASTPIAEYSFQDFSQWNIVTPPTSALLEYLLGTYQAVAQQSPNELPTLAMLSKLFTGTLVLQGDKGQNTGPLAQVRNALNYHLANPGTPLGGSAAVQQLTQLYQFLKPSWPATTLPTASTPTGLNRPTPPTLEFHQILSALASYPATLRALGIVFDLTLDPTATAALKNGAKVRVLPTRTGGAGLDKSPWTTYSTTTSNGFAAVPLASTPNAADFTTDGLLAVDQPRYSVVPLDVSGAAVNLTNFVEQVSQERLNPQSQAALPALRSNGLSLAVSGRATDIAAVFQSASQNNTAIEAQGDGGNVILGAAELNRGLCADVWDSTTQTWSSLCGRTYQINGTPAGPVTDEGTLTASATTHPASSGTGGDLHMVESLLRWMGSGLCVPPPGAPPPDKQSSLNVTVSAPSGTSPQLLFGHGYRFRLRRVDLAGNSVAATDPSIANTPHITPETPYWTASVSGTLQVSWSQVLRPTRYLRFEPVVPPVVRPVVAATALHGESTGVLVVRTSSGLVNLITPNTRRIDPPAIAPALALQHGLSAAQIKSPQFPDPATAPNPKTPLAPSTPQAKLTTYNQAVPQSAVLTYTPDPLATGVAFQVEPTGTITNLLSLSIPSVAANGSPFLLSLAPVAAGTAPSAVVSAPSAASGNLSTLTLSLPPASILKLRLSSTLNNAGAEMLALWDLTKQAIAQNNPGGGSALNQAMTEGLDQAAQGVMPMLTPYREITLVHALEKPAAPVLVDGFTWQPRTPNQTSVYLSGGLQSDRNSTTKVDVAASWTEWVDVAPAAPTQVQHTAQVLSATIAPAGPNYDTIGDGTGGLPAHQEFHDTRYRLVSYTPTASTRFAEYFAPSATPQVPDPNQQQSGAAVTLAIPSTARPPAPTVRYIMPTFRWTRVDGTDGSVTSTRLGGGFRVFLERPWYRSGDGELLAVVVADPNSEIIGTPVLPVGTGPSSNPPPQISATPVAALEPFATRVGADPLSTAIGPSTDIAVGNFLDAAASVPGGLVLPEAASANVGVAGYAVRWNAAHQAWCADIHVDPYANAGNNQHYFGYMPFLRFVLARYQPNSLPGYELSPVVRMDSVQSVPDRIASITEILSTAPAGTPQLNLNYLLQVTGETAQSSAATITWAVTLEGTISGKPTPQTEVDWEVITRGAQMELRIPNVLCAAGISLPSARGTRGYRVVVTETETYPSDNMQAMRIVYADAILL